MPSPPSSSPHPSGRPSIDLNMSLTLGGATEEDDGSSPSPPPDEAFFPEDGSDHGGGGGRESSFGGNNNTYSTGLDGDEPRVVELRSSGGDEYGARRDETTRSYDGSLMSSYDDDGIVGGTEGGGAAYTTDASVEEAHPADRRGTAITAEAAPAPLAITAILEEAAAAIRTLEACREEVQLLSVRNAVLLDDLAMAGADI